MELHQFCILFGLLLLALGIVFSFSPLWPRRAPLCLINRLPDEMLILIFSQLPLTDLLSLLPLTCRRWEGLLPAATHARRDLILQESRTSTLLAHLRYYYPSSIAGCPPAESALLYQAGSSDEHTLDETATSLLQVTLPPNLKPGTSSRQRSLHLVSLAPALPRLFPNIRRLTIAIQGHSETLSLILDLLASWAPRLTSLHLSFFANEPDSDTDGAFPREETARLCAHLQLLINSMSTLKRLHLCLTASSSSLSGRPITLHLPILSQLERLYISTHNFTSPSDVDLVLTELQHQLEVRQGEESRPPCSLKEAALYNWATLGQLTLTAPFLAKTFVRIAITDMISETNLTTFTNLSTQWPHLRSLTIRTDLPLSRFLPLLRPFTRLVQLILYLNSQTGERHQPSGEPSNQLASIQYLSLYHRLTDHQALRESLQSLSGHLPALKVAELINRSESCDDCGYEHGEATGEPERFYLHLAARCDDHGVDCLRKLFPHLSTILQSRRVKWREWKDGPVLHL